VRIRLGRLILAIWSLYDAESLTDILPIATIKSQTVTYYGLTRELIVKFVNEDHPHGVDRFVPLGK